MLAHRASVVASPPSKQGSAGSKSLRRFLNQLVAAVCFLLPLQVCAEEAEDPEQLRLSLPFAFYNETFGFSLGWVEGRVGFPQENTRVLGSLMLGSEGSALGFVMAENLQVPGWDRLFIDPIFSLGYYDQFDSYVDGNPDFPDQRAGTNDSDEDNFVTGSGLDVFTRVRFKYLLPIGHGRKQIRPDYTLVNGFLRSGATGGESLNPFKSGRSFLEARAFHRSQEVDGDDFDDEVRTNGLDLVYFWDNRNFPFNPTAGNGLKVQYSQDFGLFDSSDSWTVVAAEMDAYRELGATSRFRSRVLALGFWTADTPSWDEDGDTIDNRPPAYTGATLGGLWRMRGYPTQRFNDRSAIYYAAELRLTPHWNPFDNWSAIQDRLGVEWIQFVPFVEVGRVAGSYDLEELHSDMKWSGGAGLRAWVQGFVVRADFAVSEEGASVQMMVGQPFQF